MSSKYEIELRGFYVYSDDHGERRTIQCFDTKRDADLYADRLKVYGGATRILRARKSLDEATARSVIGKIIGRTVKGCQCCGDLHANDGAYCSDDCRVLYRTPQEDPDDSAEWDGLHECPTCGVESASLRCGCRR